MQLKAAVIGAGVSGLACAKSLAENGFNVTLFEKSRGVGGRSPTRWLNRESDPWVGLDHGAQYFHANSSEFRQVVLDAQHAAAVAPWMGRVVNLGYGQVSEHSNDSARWVGTPGMTSFAKFLSAGLSLKIQSRVASIKSDSGHWIVNLEDQDRHLTEYTDRFDWVVMAVPAEQAAVLLDGVDPKAFAMARSVRSSITWSLMLTFKERLPIDFDAAFVVDSPLGWICRDSSKPGRAPGERWVLHSTADWSRAHENDSADVVKGMMIDVFQNVTGVYSEADNAVAHRWLYSLPSNPMNDGFYLNAGSALGVCGDWLSGANIEAAFLSGLNLSASIISAQ